MQVIEYDTHHGGQILVHLGFAFASVIGLYVSE